MQVVYSGGSTPSPSPHLKRKAEYGRRNIPRYIAHVHPQIIVQRSREKFTEGDTTLRDSIPLMSKCTAVVCLVLNVILPGSGTLTAGLSVLCCSQVRPKGDSKGHCILINAGVGLIQFLLTFVFLLGWIWSIMWGVAFLAMSENYIIQKDSFRSKTKYLHKTKAKVPHKSDLLCKVSTGRNNRTAEEIINECNFHKHSSNNLHVRQCQNHTKNFQHKSLENVDPGAFSYSDETTAPSDTAKDNWSKTATNPNGSAQGSSLIEETAPEASSLEQSAALQTQPDGHDTSNTLLDLFDNMDCQNNTGCSGIPPNKPKYCSPVAHRQTVVLHNQSLHTSLPNICQNTSKQPYQVCLTTTSK